MTFHPVELRIRASSDEIVEAARHAAVCVLKTRCRAGARPNACGVARAPCDDGQDSDAIGAYTQVTLVDMQWVSQPLIWAAAKRGKRL